MQCVNDELRRRYADAWKPCYGFRSSSGSLAMFAAMRRTPHPPLTPSERNFVLRVTSGIDPSARSCLCRAHRGPD